MPFRSSQTRDVTTHFNSTRSATGCTKTRELTGSPQPTDVSRTMVVWLSSTTTFDSIFPALWWPNRRGLDWWSHGGRGLI